MPRGLRVIYLGTMSNIYTLGLRSFSVVGILLLFLLGLQNNLNAQCANNNTFLLDMTPSAPGVTVTTTCMRGGRYATVTVCAGAQYTFSTCGSNGFDTQITLYNNAGGAALGFNDDFCGLQSQITWTATFSGTLRVLVDRYNCSNSGTCQTLDVTWNTGCPSSGNPGDNCSTAIPVACGQTRTGETTIGNGDSGNNWSCYSSPISTPGADRFYALSVTDPSATVVRVTLTNVVDNDTYVEVILLGTGCVANTCTDIRQFTVSSGTFSGNGLTSFDFAVSGAGTWYFVIDSQSDGVTSYDIGFDCIATGVKLDTSGCPGPPPDLDHNGYECTWNGGPPGAVSHGDAGTLCYTIFTKNPSASGWEWLKYVDITMGDCWRTVTNITPDAPPNDNGYYNLLGEWQGAYNVGANMVQYDFTNSVNPAWGDGTAPNFTCQAYDFCFDAVVDTNGCPGAADNDLNNIIYIEDDGVGGSGNSQASNALVLAPDFFFTNILSVNLYDFDVYAVSDGIRIKWITASEDGTDRFLLSRSTDGQNFESLADINANGSWNTMNAYDWIDPQPENGENIYRLTEVDEEGRSTILGTKSAWYSTDNKMVLGNIIPNPAHTSASVSVFCPDTGNADIELYSSMGRKVMQNRLLLAQGNNNWNVDLSSLRPGTYIVKLTWKNQVETLRLVVE